MTTTNIKRIIKRTKGWLPLIGALPLALLSTSCIYDGEACPEPTGKETQYTLRLNIMAQNSSTRAGDHLLVNGIEAENFINIAKGDYKIVLYNSSTGEYITEINDPQFSEFNTGDKKYYLLEKIFFQAEDEANPGNDELSKEILEGSVNILVLVNWNSYESGSAAIYPMNLAFTQVDKNKTENSLWRGDNDLIFNTQVNSESSWCPSIDNESYIPMFGYAENVEFNRNIGNINSSYTVTNIPMLRALAKIEIVDKIPGNTLIKDVNLTSYNTTGRIVPDITSNNMNWGTPATQIVKETLPQTVLPSSTGLKLFKIENGFGTNNEFDGYVAYIPEMTLVGGQNLSDPSRPRLTVKVGTKGDASNDLTYEVHFADYVNGIVANGYTGILRNHIYHFDINSVNVTADITLHVNPWDDAKEEIWYYEELPGTIEPIEWFYGEEEAPYNDKTAEVTLNISDEADKILKGVFTIDQPLSGTWHAYLMTVGDALATAIQFCDKDGKDLVSDGLTIFSDHHISGPISENKERADELNIFIKSTELGVSGESRFKLLVMVENMGTWMEVNLAPGDNKNWIIIRPSNDFNSGNNSGSTTDNSGNETPETPDNGD